MKLKPSANRFQNYLIFDDLISIWLPLDNECPAIGTMVQFHDPQIIRVRKENSLITVKFEVGTLLECPDLHFGSNYQLTHFCSSSGWSRTALGTTKPCLFCAYSPPRLSTRTRNSSFFKALVSMLHQ